jgi:serine/threonine-protein kinase
MCVGAALLAGCGTVEPPVGQSGFWRTNVAASRTVKSAPLKPTYKISGPLLYVANYDQTLQPLAIFLANVDKADPIATIGKDIDNSSGVCIDGNGTLYVTNQPGSSGWVSEYPLGGTKPLRVITKGINTPAFCAIDASGNLWVTNIGANDVTEYLKGSSRPHTTITQGLTYPDGIAIDHAGNLYVGNLEPHSAPNIQVYAPGKKAPSRTITDGVTWPVGICVDSHDTLYVTNGTVQGNVEEYQSGQSKPYRTITDKLSYPVDVVVSPNGWLYVANDGQYLDQTAILEFPPRSVKYSRIITKGIFNPEGLAYYPPILP